MAYTKEEKRQYDIARRVAIKERRKHDKKYDAMWKERERKQNYLKHRRSKEKINHIKSLNGCSKCGNTNPVVLVFHHTGLQPKKFDISQAWAHKWTDVLLEIAKCVILCQNCHAVHHDAERKRSEQAEKPV